MACRGARSGPQVDTGLRHRGCMTGVCARVEGYLEEGVKDQGMEGPAWGITGEQKYLLHVTQRRAGADKAPAGGPAVRGDRVR